MVEVKTIKDIDDRTWNEFKELAAKNDVKLGVFFKTLVKGYEKRTAENWEKILAGEKILTDKEAEELEAEIKHRRKEYGFRT